MRGRQIALQLIRVTAAAHDAKVRLGVMCACSCISLIDAPSAGLSTTQSHQHMTYSGQEYSGLGVTAGPLAASASPVLATGPQREDCDRRMLNGIWGIVALIAHISQSGHVYAI